MTAVHLVHPAQVERLLAGGPRYVRVPEVRCVVHRTNRHSLCDGCHATNLVPDPSWVAAAEPCETCGGKRYDRSFVARGGDGYAPPCPACNGSGVPLIAVTVPCPQGLITADGYDHSWCGRTTAEPLRCQDGTVPLLLDGKPVHVRIEGELLPIMHWSTVDAESPSCISVGHDDGRRAFASVGWSHHDISDQLPWLAPNGTDELTGRWAAKVVLA